MTGLCVSHYPSDGLSLFPWQQGANNINREGFQVYYLSFANCLLINASDNAITESTWKSSTEDEYRDAWTN